MCSGGACGLVATETVVSTVFSLFADTVCWPYVLNLPTRCRHTLREFTSVASVPSDMQAVTVHRRRQRSSRTSGWPLQLSTQDSELALCLGKSCSPLIAFLGCKCLWSLHYSRRCWMGFACGRFHGQPRWKSWQPTSKADIVHNTSPTRKTPDKISRNLFNSFPSLDRIPPVFLPVLATFPDVRTGADGLPIQ